MKFDAKRLSALLYQMGIADDHLVHDNQGARIDAALSMVFARQLEYQQAQFQETIYPELIAREVIPIDYSIPNGADAMTVTRLEDVGEADFVTGAATDYPNVEIFGTQTTQRIVTFGDSYQYTIQEMRAAAMAGVQLDDAKSKAARRIIERKLDAIAFLGVAQASIPGLATSSLVTPTVLTGAWSNPATTGDSILQDVMALWQAIYTKSGGAIEPDTLVLPLAANSAFSTRYMSAYDRRFVLQAIKESTPFKNVRATTKLALANAGGNGPRVVAYKYDKEIVDLAIPQEIESTQPQAIGRAFRVFSDMRTGGVRIKNPLGIAYGDSML